mmetsp:Transcript_11202/g.20031  ORF Transcript_11202/g.20031 Transcript_11202/m.20031 type:complete len:328 (+) Transcript_11202:59-1042(+)
MSRPKPHINVDNVSIQGRGSFTELPQVDIEDEEATPGWDDGIRCGSYSAGDWVEFFRERDGCKLGEARQRVMGEFAVEFGCWDDRLVCGNYTAGDRCSWLMHRCGYKVAQARHQVMREYPDEFAAFREGRLTPLKAEHDCENIAPSSSAGYLDLGTLRALASESGDHPGSVSARKAKGQIVLYTGPGMSSARAPRTQPFFPAARRDTMPRHLAVRPAQGRPTAEDRTCEMINALRRKADPARTCKRLGLDERVFLQHVIATDRQRVKAASERSLPGSRAAPSEAPTFRRTAGRGRVQVAAVSTRPTTASPLNDSSQQAMAQRMRRTL